MANPNNPTGFQPWNQPGGNVRLTLYKADTTYAIYKGDPVTLTNAGKAQRAAPADNAAILGIALGFVDSEQAGFGNDIEKYPYLPKNTEGPYVLVCDDANQKYVVQSDTGGSNLSLTHIGNSASWVDIRATSGNSYSGVSYAELDSSDAAADTGGCFRIVGFVDAVDNSTGNWARVIVTVNHPQIAAESVGTAI